MRLVHPLLLLAISPAFLAAPAQQPSSGTAPAAIAPNSLSSMLQPALDTVGQTVAALNLDKWKRGNIREDAAHNVGAIQRDLKQNLPPLLQDADAAPGAVSKALPVAQNIDAMYDVLLRIVEAAQVSAPGEQVDQLQSALAGLGKARLALADRLQGSATALEKQVADLRVTVQKQTAEQAAARSAAVPVAPVCPAPPARKTTAKRKPAAKPAQTAPAKPGQTPSTTTTPSATPNPNSNTAK